MCHQPITHKLEPSFSSNLNEPLLATPCSLEIQPYHVSLSRLINHTAHAGPEVIDLAGHFMGGFKGSVFTVGRFAKSLLHGNATCRGKNTGLTKATTDGLANPASVLQRGLGTHEHTSSRCTKTLGKAQGDGVKVRAVFSQRPSSGYDSFP
ncbi:hypothetical protein HG531_002921 [Fusarium graminearum]|nr:hypothetical protein HG531_002921 [Fusarium graminearum]